MPSPAGMRYGLETSIAAIARLGTKLRRCQRLGTAPIVAVHANGRQQTAPMEPITHAGCAVGSSHVNSREPCD